ncbi:MAG: hypothetical protein A2798_01795 [Candidatus Levybacteria bacterium RIFCSPHIGHO2_01_FULL_37_17]|nr:MAG: hypothetical protein A2798_01795 [Candidatus Levybacteria bacterium RIFCSPHIGHO2_01_FULL_37_17]OGH37181.1 MAG: hypothetical protein A2959_02655 [Candidatus Levybacteria bacterium RIFCSPLOWO2_01_FULL_38_23]
MDIKRINHKNFQFLSIANPRDEVLKKLIKAYKFNPLDLEDFENKTQISKIEVYEDYSLIVLDFPVLTTAKNYIERLGEDLPSTPYVKRPLKFVKSTISNILTLPTKALSYTLPKQAHPEKKRIFYSQVYLFMGKGYLILLHDNEIPILDEIFKICEKNISSRDDFMGKGPIFFGYRIIDALVDMCFPIVNELSAKIERIDRHLETKKSQDILEDISVTRRNIVYFHTMIRAVLPILKQLEEGKYEVFNGTMKSYWGNVLDHIQTLSERLENNRELIEGISESNESLINSKNNEIIAFLTIIFTLTIPATVFGTFFGMNILLPGGIETGPWDFWGPYTTFILICIISIVPILIMLFYFRIKRWI